MNDLWKDCQLLFRCKNAELEEGIVSMCRATKYCDTLQLKVVCYKVMHDAMLNAIV